MLSDLPTVFGSTSVRDRLNAPYGARCFLTKVVQIGWHKWDKGLNAPYGARCFLTQPRTPRSPRKPGLNAPYGARCFLTDASKARETRHLRGCHNAPYGARCFLTLALTLPRSRRISHNAPYGARCFLTPGHLEHDDLAASGVIMHLMALGAF